MSDGLLSMVQVVNKICGRVKPLFGGCFMFVALRADEYRYSSLSSNFVNEPGPV